MRAAVHYEYGNTDLLQITEIDVPNPDPNECLVRVRVEWKYLEGRWRPFTGKTFPRKIGARVTAVCSTGKLEFTRAVEALRLPKKGHALGEIVIDI